MTGKKPIPNLDDLVRRYQSGESMNQLAPEAGVDRGTLRSRMVEHGVEIRGRSAAEREWWRRNKGDRSIVERKLSAAWVARRGSHDPVERMIRRAKTMYERQVRIGRGEAPVASALREAGFAVAHQFPVGPYNLDIAIRECSVSVEIQIGNLRKANGSGGRERIEYILDAGWSVLVAYASAWKRFDLVAVSQQVVAFANLASRDPSTRGQYGMIWGDGKPYSPKGFDFPRRPRVPGF